MSNSNNKRAFSPVEYRNTKVKNPDMSPSIVSNNYMNLTDSPSPIKTSTQNSDIEPPYKVEPGIDMKFSTPIKPKKIELVSTEKKNTPSSEEIHRMFEYDSSSLSEQQKQPSSPTLMGMGILTPDWFNMSTNRKFDRKNAILNFQYEIETSLDSQPTCIVGIVTHTHGAIPVKICKKINCY